jgi:hypothetical protein
MTDTMTSQNTDLSSRNTLYNQKYWSYLNENNILLTNEIYSDITLEKIYINTKEITKVKQHRFGSKFCAQNCITFCFQILNQRITINLRVFFYVITNLLTSVTVIQLSRCLMYS